MIGGGVIGLFCAYHLKRAGADVVLIDKSDFGSGCSFANGGWVCPSIATPLPAPGLATASLRGLLRSDSPFYIKPSAVPHLGRWLWEFRGHCNADSYTRGVAALAELSRGTPKQYAQLGSDGVDFEYDRRGTLLAFSDARSLEREHRDLMTLGAFGLGPIDALDETGLRKDQPGLAGDLIGGLIIRDEVHVRPDTLCRGLATRIEADGVEVLPGLEVSGFEVERGTIVAATGPGIEITADAFVVATGAEASFLTTQLGMPLPVQAGKGYSITIEGPAATVSRPTHVSTAKMGFTPFAGAHRLLGTMELSGINRRLDPRRIEALERAGRRALPGCLDGATRSDWVGMRPVTPDGLPVIGALATCVNGFVATGHQMLGVTLAPSTGSVIAQLVLEGRVEKEVSAFSPTRF